VSLYIKMLQTESGPTLRYLHVVSKLCRIFMWECNKNILSIMIMMIMTMTMKMMKKMVVSGCTRRNYLRIKIIGNML
jgi:hypothetical protein